MTKAPSEPRPNSTSPGVRAAPKPLSETETRRLNDKIGEEARRQAEVGQTVRGKGG